MAANGDQGIGDGQKALYDRQIHALGMKTMQSLAKARVLIVGMRGLGVEIAKNVILAGPSVVTLADSAPVDRLDLAAQFYLSEADVGSNRAEACIDRLRELNPYVDVSAHTGSLQVGFLQQFTVIVMTASTPEDRERVNAFCREQSPPIKFIAAEAHGLSGFIFDDFGPEPGHLVTDATGERERSAFVGYIEKTNPCRVVFLQDFGYAFMSDDWVSFKEVRGMTQLNGIDASPIKIVDRYTIELTNVDATDFDDHTGGGIAFQVKQEVRVPMRSLAECNTDLASIMPHDWSKAIAPDQIHACFRGLHAFQAEHGGGLPELGVKAHEEAVASATAAFLESLGEGAPEVPDWLPRLVARQARVELSPVASILGGMAAQEVIKATGSKNLPINQFFYFNGFEALADGAAAAEAEPVQEADLPAAPFRSFGELICFGPEMVNSLANLRTFVVGAGALGCEFLKGFAMMGVAVGESGAVTVTDMDHIEISNLNRQFLFRSEHIGQSKATVAGGAAATLNPAIKVVTMEDRVGRDTENVFHDDFWRGQDVIVNALDNVKARLYVDSKCVEFHRPLLESGTLGTKSNVQVVIPSLTEAYGSSRDAPASEIPLCTLHNFPYLVEHCIQLSREQFETYFKKVAVDTVSWIEKGTDHLEAMKNEHERRTAIEAVADLIAFADGADFASCVNWARERFEALYNHHFRDMLVSFPADKLDSHGNPFWSGTKRLPHPLEFDIEDPLHYGFIEAGANLRAALIGIPPERDAAVIRGLIEAAPVPEYAPKHLKVQTDEKQKVSLASEEDGQVIARLVEETPRDVNAGAFVPAEFEKDDDSNFHIDYIYCAANLRARCYDIEEKERMDVKRIAGNIIPALATTTSMTTGLVLIELYKTVQGLPVEAFRNSFVNLALPLVTFSEPLPPPTFKSPGPEGQSFFPEGYSIWDKIEIAGGPDVTLQDVVDHFASTQNMELTMVSIGEALIYAGFMPGHASRPAQKLVDLYTTVAKKEIGPAQTRLQLDVECEDADGTEFSCAPVYVGIR